MNYVVAGYSFVLGLLFLYAVQLLWRRRRLTRLVLRAEAHDPVSAPADPVSAPALVSDTFSAPPPAGSQP